MKRKLWWFLLFNNLIILFLFVRKMIVDGDITIGLDLNFSDWKIQTPSSNVVLGALPFVFSLGFILYKIITYSGTSRSTPVPEVLDS